MRWVPLSGLPPLVVLVDDSESHLDPSRLHLQRLSCARRLLQHSPAVTTAAAASLRRWIPRVGQKSRQIVRGQCHCIKVNGTAKSIWYCRILACFYETLSPSLKSDYRKLEKLIDVITIIIQRFYGDMPIRRATKRVIWGLQMFFSLCNQLLKGRLALLQYVRIRPLLELVGTKAEEEVLSWQLWRVNAPTVTRSGPIKGGIRKMCVNRDSLWEGEGEGALFVLTVATVEHTRRKMVAVFILMQAVCLV
jgi:hypothetical protein